MERTATYHIQSGSGTLPHLEIQTTGDVDWALDV